MPRFFFDFRCEGHKTPDETGVEFESAEAAFVAATDAARGMWGELLKNRQDPRLCAFDIRGEGRALLFKLPFGELLENCRKVPAVPAVPAVHKALREIWATQAYADRLRGELKDQVAETRKTLAESQMLLKTRF